MDILILFLTLWRVCHAGWPWCCKQTDDNGAEAIYAQESEQTRRLTPVHLDLLSPDKGKIYVDDREKDEVRQKDFVPKKGYKIASVSYDSQELWTGNKEGNDKCQLVEIYVKDNSEILTLNITKDNEFKPKFFEKLTSGWMPISMSEFFDKLGKMRDGDWHEDSTDV